MKKTIYSIMAALAVFAFISCDNGTSLEEDNNTDTPQETPVETSAETPKEETKVEEPAAEEEEVETRVAFNEPLTLEFKEDGRIIILNPLPTLKFSKNGGVLTPVTITDEDDNTAEITVAKDDKISFYAVTTNYVINQDDDIENCMMIKANVASYVYGNVMSLLTLNESTGEWNPKATVVKDGSFACLFYDYAYIENHPTKPLYLPATTLAKYCYAFMFSSCNESFTRAPELPATTLEEGCYESMFEYCEQLETAPDLPATTLANMCYYGMFEDCSKLTKAPVLAAKNLKKQCYQSMFSGCKSLTKAPELPAEVMEKTCYSSMFEGCTNLTSAPALPATTLARWCYDCMFKGCTELTAAPTLQATTLIEGCYSQMFEGCTKLSTITCLATDISANDCTRDWVKDVADTGTFVKASSADWTLKTGESGIPSGWTTQDAE